MRLTFKNIFNNSEYFFIKLIIDCQPILQFLLIVICLYFHMQFSIVLFRDLPQRHYQRPVCHIILSPHMEMSWQLVLS